MKELILILALIGSIFCVASEGESFSENFWNCCKPPCGWIPVRFDNEEKDRFARTCTLNQETVDDEYENGVCTGGTVMACLDQSPIIINDSLAYGFASAPSEEYEVCGKCYELTFTGAGKYETRDNHRKIKGKKMVVMINTPAFANQNFGLMIPGGAVGFYGGCDEIFGTDMGSESGGFLLDCEREVGYDKSEAEIYKQRKDCLRRKCDKFTISTAKEGCLFAVDWFEGARQPKFTYKETKCPEELKKLY